MFEVLLPVKNRNLNLNTQILTFELKVKLLGSKILIFFL